MPNDRAIFAGGSKRHDNVDIQLSTNFIQMFWKAYQVVTADAPVMINISQFSVNLLKHVTNYKMYSAFNRMSELIHTNL